MKQILILLLALMLGGCMTVGRIERNCDKFARLCVDEERIIEYRDTVIFRTDTIRVPLPYRDTVFIRDTVKIRDNKAFMKPVHKEVGIIGVDAWVNFSVLGVNAYLTDSTVLYMHNDTIYVEKVKEVIKEKTVVKRSRIEMTIVIVMIVLTGAIVMRLRKYV